jgi:predicted CXXCH cytochrome family protein
VYKVSDFAYFNHEPHLRKGVDCGVCHGDVKSMDRIILNQTLTMGFCVDCHRKPEYKATVDCWACHR